MEEILKLTHFQYASSGCSPGAVVNVEECDPDELLGGLPNDNKLSPRDPSDIRKFSNQSFQNMIPNRDTIIKMMPQNSFSLNNNTPVSDGKQSFVYPGVRVEEF